MSKRSIVVLASTVALTSSAACSSGSADDAAAQSTAATATEQGTMVSGGSLSNQYFCPTDLIPRKDMARYLERLKRGRDYTPPPAQGVFQDVPRDSIHAPWIEQLYADGITRGTSPGFFSPNDPVPREQMAAFIVRLFHGPDFSRGGPSRFSDVSNPDFIGYIEQLADDGITRGCTPTEFCPGDMVPREQMAAFLMRAAHPGSSDPPASGRFADVPKDRDLAGRVEQAVAEGIMEPCSPATRTPIFAFGLGGNFGVDIDQPPPTIDNFLGWIPTTPSYGLYVHERKKQYLNPYHQSSCGGDYTATAVLDIGEVRHDGVYVRSITFYTQGVPEVMHQDSVWVGTNGNIQKFGDYNLGLDDFGIPYLSFRVEHWFPNGQGANGDALQVQHTMLPDGKGTPLVKFKVVGTPGAPGGASVVAGLSDNPDGGMCGMILRGALSIY